MKGNNSAFRSVLLRKAQHNFQLTKLIESLDSDSLTSMLIDSLEKMARPAKSMGSNANSAITSFAAGLTNKDVEMMRDALGHHISAHKAELKAGNRVAADAHLSKIIPLMHMAAKAAAHSNGRLALDYVPLEPWESNYTTLERRPETGKLKEGTKGLGRRPSRTDRSINPRGVPDYRYLEMRPHGGHQDTKTSPHAEKGYPFEEIQLGDSNSVDNNRAYLPITNMEPAGVFRPHPFDDHPIHRLAHTDQNSISEADQARFASDLVDWVNHDSNKKWSSSIKEAYAANPELFKQRGRQKPGHHFDDISLLEQPDEARQHVAAPTKRTSSALGGIDMSLLPPELRSKHGQMLQQLIQPSAEDDLLANLPAELRAKHASMLQSLMQKPAEASQEMSDEDVEKTFMSATDEEKKKLWPRYKAILDRKHGG